MGGDLGTLVTASARLRGKRGMEGLLRSATLGWRRAFIFFIIFFFEFGGGGASELDRLEYPRMKEGQGGHLSSLA